jgi:hypothetical protein
VGTNMLKGVSVIAAAAVCAGVIVGFIPEPEPAAAAATPRSTPRNEQVNVAAGAPIAVTTSACTQTWPYYEQSCLRDNRHVRGGAPSARVIPSTYPVKVPGSKIARLAGGSR